MAGEVRVSGPLPLIERDPALVERFLSLIADGVPRSYACLGCGFAYRTLYGWVRKGLLPNAAEPYASFTRRLYEVEVELMRKWLKRLDEAGVEYDNGKPVYAVDSKALMWLLERRFPKAFGADSVTLIEEPEPVDDVSRELESESDHWDVLRQWFLEPTAQLVQLVRETQLLERVGSLTDTE